MNQGAVDPTVSILEGQRRALDLALANAPLRAVLEQIVATVEAQSSHDAIGSILLLDPATSQLRHGAAPSLPPKYCDAIDGIVIGPGVGSCGTAAFTGNTVFVEDIEHDPLWVDFKNLALEFGLRACWSTPIISSVGSVLGTFALYHRRPMMPTTRDRRVVDMLAPTAAFIIERARSGNAELTSHRR
jgi:GAF domain-containing protein